MKYKTTGFIIIFLSALFLSNMGFAEFSETTSLEREAQMISLELKELALQHKEDRCAGDVEMASILINQARGLIAEHQWMQALSTMTYSQYELEAINHIRAYCNKLAIPIKPYIYRVKLLNAKLKELQRHIQK